MNDFIPQGNVDTEGGDSFQTFSDTPTGGFSAYGNTDPEWVARPPAGASHTNYYATLGQQVMRMMQQRQQSQQMTGPQGGGQMGYGGGGGGGLTSGFDPNWLMTQTNAGSANGQKI